MNREQLIYANKIAGDGNNEATFTTGFEFIEGPNGEPLGVDVGETRHATVTGFSVTAHEVRAAGLTATDLPNLNIVEMD